jgi:pimeloyl-ACP methyl ester carboxylesterase
MKHKYAPSLGAIMLLTFLLGCAHPQLTEEIVFYSGPFKLVGNLTLPEGRGPHPLVIFVHGDGSNDRTAGGTYLPIMERMLNAGYAIFAWDKPGTGQSTGEIDRNQLIEQRSQIVLKAISVMTEHPEIDSTRIGMWGISQAGYIMPAVLSRNDNIAFMIAVSCPGEAGVEQGAYLISAQAICAGLPSEDAKQVEDLLSAIERAQTYKEYKDLISHLDDYWILSSLDVLGFSPEIKPQAEWHVPNLQGDYFRDPMQIIEQTTIPILAFFGSQDTQVDPIQGADAYRAALQRAGHPFSRVVLIQNVDHNIVVSETGCLVERKWRSSKEWLNYPPEYLDMLEEWLEGLQF